MSALERKAAILTQSTYFSEAVDEQLRGRRDRIVTAVVGQAVRNRMFSTIPHRGAEMLATYTVDAG